MLLLENILKGLIPMVGKDRSYWIISLANPSNICTVLKTNLVDHMEIYVEK